MSLIRYLTLLSLKFDFTFFIKEISSKNNKIADQLSRFKKFNINVSNSTMINCENEHKSIKDFVKQEITAHKDLTNIL